MREHRAVVDTNILRAGLYSSTGASYQVLRLIERGRVIHFLWRPALSDPKDDHILELAVASGNADIVTHNVRDFVAAAAFGIRIMTPSKRLGEMR